MKTFICKLIGCKLNWNATYFHKHETRVECSRCNKVYCFNEAMHCYRIEQKDKEKLCG